LAAEIIAAILFIILALIGLLITFFGISGTWIVLIGAITYNLITWSWAVTIYGIVLLLVLATAGEIIEFSLGGMAVRKYGGTRTASIAAIICGITGAIIGIPGMLLGSVFGLLIGAFAGAFIIEILIKKDLNKALTAACGALIGGIGGKIIKLLILIIMIIIVLMIIF